MTPEELEKIRASGVGPTPEQIEDYNETLRQYRTRCSYCNHSMIGTLAEIRAFFRRCNRLCKHDPAT